MVFVKDDARMTAIRVYQRNSFNDSTNRFSALRINLRVPARSDEIKNGAHDQSKMLTIPVEIHNVITFTILTINANPLMAENHDRMPVLIRPEDYTAWIDRISVMSPRSLAQPYAERFMEAYPISRKVNSPKDDSPDLIEPRRKVSMNETSECAPTGPN